MALFKRADLKAKGLSDEQIEWIMTEAGRSLAANYVTKSDSDAAVEAAKTAQKEDPTQSEAYVQLAAKAAKLEAFQGAEFADVKAPYKDMIWNQLDHKEGHKPYSEQLTAVKESMPDLFKIEKDEQPEAQQNKPQFGASTGGSIPKGENVPSFGDFWGFGKA